MVAAEKTVVAVKVTVVERVEREAKVTAEAKVEGEVKAVKEAAGATVALEAIAEDAEAKMVGIAAVAVEAPRAAEVRVTDAAGEALGT
jgi:hypothetical protein